MELKTLNAGHEALNNVHRIILLKLKAHSQDSTSAVTNN